MERAIPPARMDGRPLYFDKPGPSQCEVCLRMGVTTTYQPGQNYMTDRANSPFGPQDTGSYVICHGHLPDNAVIYDPLTQELRTKDGRRRWREDEGSELRPGDRVMVQRMVQPEDGEGFARTVNVPATLLAIQARGQFHVSFNDGTRETVDWVRKLHHGEEE